MDTEYQTHKVQFDLLLSLLLEWNKSINLTGITEPSEVVSKHFLDSLTVLEYIPATAKTLIDVGSGAGFPGLPIAITRPDIKVTLLESIAKKVNFLEECIDKLNLENVESMVGRAEDAARLPELREQFDVATARAVAHLSVLAEYTLPFLKIGGVFIAQKKAGDEEITTAASALQILGGEIVSQKNIDETKQIIVIKKVKSTPEEYPRRAGVPLRKPL
jgi:16S rRNA (guanine527-N7)-methyltransferase